VLLLLLLGTQTPGDVQHQQQFPAGRVFNLQSRFVAAAAGGLVDSMLFRELFFQVKNR